MAGSGLIINNGGGLPDQNQPRCGNPWKCKGALKKTSGRSYSLERPVARHFVWRVLLHLLYQHHFRRKLLKTSRGRMTGPCRNCQAAGKNYLCRCRQASALPIFVENGCGERFCPGSEAVRVGRAGGRSLSESSACSARWTGFPGCDCLSRKTKFPFIIDSLPQLALLCALSSVG
jgi:hypothetical protein